MSSSKLSKLKEIRKQINMGINGNNHKEDGVSNIYVSNHSCLKDGFYVPMALDHEIVVVVSSRVIYKNIESRKKSI